MEGLKTVERYGGINTTDPSCQYNPLEQHAVLKAMFGPNHPEGSLILPDGSPLYIGERIEGSGYSNGRIANQEPYDFSLFCPAYESGDNRTLIDVMPGGGIDGNGLDHLGGFLYTAFGMILLLGRKSMLELVTGERQEFGKISKATQEKRDYLAQLVMFDVLYNDSEHGADEDWLGDLEAGIDDLLGEDLARLEVSLPEEDHPFSLAERPYENLVVQIANRFSEIVEEPARREVTID